MRARARAQPQCQWYTLSQRAAGWTGPGGRAAGPQARGRRGRRGHFGSAQGAGRRAIEIDTRDFFRNRCIGAVARSRSLWLQIMSVGSLCALVGRSFMCPICAHELSRRVQCAEFSELALAVLMSCRPKEPFVEIEKASPRPSRLSFRLFRPARMCGAAWSLPFEDTTTTERKPLRCDLCDLCRCLPFPHLFSCRAESAVHVREQRQIQRRF